jgi:hypothetical protein
VNPQSLGSWLFCVLAIAGLGFCPPPLRPGAFALGASLREADFFSFSKITRRAAAL